ncbi:PKD domain-containing protein [Candidatus Magnetomorum sp. HK-1]|nr:PKD domain-containing protein [Candidatus Magnetomorum sp. HK-1]
MSNTTIVRAQTNGFWKSGGYGNESLHTPWAIIMLSPSLFVQPPVADIGVDIIWRCGIEMEFDASKSMHIDASQNIVKYEWDWEGDGIWDTETTTPNATHTYPCASSPQLRAVSDNEGLTITMKLRVTDENGTSSIATRKISLKESNEPLAPYAKITHPGTVTAGIPFNIDGTKSFDLDTNDKIAFYEWDLDNDGKWFDDIDYRSENGILSYSFQNIGVYNIGLRVIDDGASNNYIPLTSTVETIAVNVEGNLTPAANAGGPYTATAGQSFKLDGSKSSEPNYDPLIYAWDLDNDGQFDDSSVVYPEYTWASGGSFRIGLKVSDTLASDTTYITITVNNAPPKSKDDSSGGCFISSTIQANALSCIWNNFKGRVEKFGSRFASFNIKN